MIPVYTQGRFSTVGRHSQPSFTGKEPEHFSDFQNAMPAIWITSEHASSQPGYEAVVLSVGAMLLKAQPAH